MKKKIVTKNKKSREEISHPYLKYSIEERLIFSESIDLENNFTIETIGDYSIVKPIDKNKKIKTVK